MFEIELSWLAGFLEGDGSFIIAKTSSSYQYRIVISQSLKDTHLIDETEKIYKKLETNYYIYDSLKRKYPQRMIYVSRKNDVYKLMKMIRQYMRGRKGNQIDLMVKCIDGKMDPEEARRLFKSLSIRSHDGKRGGRKPSKIPASDYETIKKRYKDGETLSNIAKDYDVTKQAIWYIINRK